MSCTLHFIPCTLRFTTENNAMLFAFLLPQGKRRSSNLNASRADPQAVTLPGG